MQRVKFNPSNPNLRVIPSSFTIDDLINPQIITIYCDDDLQEDESIDVLFSEKKLLVGKLNVMRNINSDKNIVNFRVVYVKKKSVENDFKNIEEKIAKNEAVVLVDPQYFRPTEVDLLIGDPTKSQTVLGWKPEYDLKGLIEDMMRSDIKLFKRDAYLKEGGFTVMNYFE